MDFVVPGGIQYLINSSNSVLISAKTSLRERWQGVPEEMSRAGAGEMFLITLDSKISLDVLETLKVMNIQVVTTQSIKKQFYSSYSQVLSFKQLIGICLKISEKWKNYPYSLSDKTQIVRILKREISKHSNQKFLKEYYEKRLENLERIF